MRIISGKFKGHKIVAPKNLPTRPTTDRSKESLFNILNNWYDFENCKVLDLFTGTGNLSFEFASRGAKEITSIDRHKPCTDFIKKECEKLGITQVQVLRMDVMDYISHSDEKFDIIFADPPYTLFSAQHYERLHQIVFDRELLNKDGILGMEHHSIHDFSKLKHFLQKRKYGQNILSFYGDE